MSPAGALLALFATRRFWPLCLVQALGAFNDNLVRNALVVLVLLKGGHAGPALVALAAGLFIFPYALFSATAGELSDAKDKARLIRILKLAELGLMSLAALGFVLGSLPILLLVLIGLGVQAAFFGPLKYGILPDHLGTEELLSGNALIEATTFVAILAGTIAGGWLVLPPHSPLRIAFVGVGGSVVGALAALAIPPAPPRAQAAADWHILRATKALLRATLASPTISEPVLGISWFWTLGALVVAAFPVTAKLTLGASEDVVGLFLTAFSLGVGMGSLASAWILRGKASARDAPLALLGVSLFAWDFATRALQARGLTSVAAILGSAEGWRILLDLVLLSACGGFYSVPLYTLLQERAEPAWRARVMAANNVLNAAFMVGGAVIAAGLSAGGVAAPRILMLTALVNLFAVLWSIRLVPPATMLRLLRAGARVFFRATISGLEHYPPPDERAVVVPNHVSYIDGPLLAAFLPDQPVFAVDITTAKRWWARPFLRWAQIVTVDPLNPFAVRSMIEAVRQGRRLVVFPEGRLSTTGGLMKIYDGAGMIADRAQAKLVPVRIEGTEFSPFSHLGGKLRRRWFPRVRITVFPPRALSLEPRLVGRLPRHAAAQAVYQAMVHAAFAAQRLEGTLFSALCDAPSRYGWRLRVLRDAEHAPVDYRRILLGAVTFGRALAKETALGEHVGLLLPNSLAAVIALMGLLAFGRIPAVLNLTVGAEGWLSACRTAKVRRVVSSRRFAERGRLQKDIAQAGGQISFLWLEDVAASLDWRARMRGVTDMLWRAGRLPGYRGQADDPAVVLFTSGTEGTPKGVVLSHRNILANCAQAAAAVDFTSADRVFNALPMFHAFGLTVGTLLPLFRGVPNFLYPTPLHYRLVPELIYSTDATIVFGTETFLAGWARYAHPYDFRSVRYVFAGAERVREATRRLYADRFGVRLLEGYGATETAPVLSINTPLRNRLGSVGPFLPGIAWRLEQLPGLEGGGRLWVKGPNVMLGYFRASAPGVLEPPPDGWYDTGDIVTVDAEGFVFVKDRAKRFAKIGGELVPMAVSEALAESLWPSAAHAVVALPDPQKGERLVLVTTSAAATWDALLKAARERGIAELMLPRKILYRTRLPRLGTGKIDYSAVQSFAQSELAA